MGQNSTNKNRTAIGIQLIVFLVFVFATPCLAGNYMISGSIDGTGTFIVDDHLDVYLNGFPIFIDVSPGAGVRNPIPVLNANVGDEIRFSVRDTFGDCRSLSRLFLTDLSGLFVEAHPGYNGGCGNPIDTGEVHSYTITIPEMAPPPLRIVFYARPEPAVLQIYSMNPNGMDIKLLSMPENGDFHPSVSRNGARIVFTSLRGNDAEDIYIMNSEGGSQTRLTNNSANDEQASISADGTKVVFRSLRDGNWEIYSINANGTNEIRLTNNTSRDEEPAFSPDGSKIVFRSNRDGLNGLFIMDANGANQTRLTSLPTDSVDRTPSFSPDGTKILFECARPPTGREICIINADGTNLVNLTNNTPIVDFEPSFSPDGSQIAFVSLRDGNPEIYVMNSDGTNQVRVTANTFEDGRPAWGGLASQPNTGIGTNVTVASQNGDAQATFSQVTAAGETTFTQIDPNNAGPLPPGYVVLPGVAAYEINTTASFAGNITVCINVPNVNNSGAFALLSLFHGEGGMLVDVTTSRDFPTRTICGTVTALSPFVIAYAAPTAAKVAVGGRVVDATGRGLHRVSATLSDKAGNSRTVLTGTFGFFRFLDVQSGETYIVSVSHKRFQFSAASQIVAVNDNIEDLQFTASPVNPLRGLDLFK